MRLHRRQLLAAGGLLAAGTITGLARAATAQAGELKPIKLPPPIGRPERLARVAKAQALMQANDTPFGLAAYVYSGSARCLARITDGLQVGMVAQNSGVLSSEVVPFGGVKQSGYGREGSRHGLAEYMAMKLVNAPAA